MLRITGKYRGPLSLPFDAETTACNLVSPMFNFVLENLNFLRDIFDDQSLLCGVVFFWRKIHDFFSHLHVASFFSPLWSLFHQWIFEIRGSLCMNHPWGWAEHRYSIKWAMTWQSMAHGMNHGSRFMRCHPGIGPNFEKRGVFWLSISYHFQQPYNMKLLISILLQRF